MSTFLFLILAVIFFVVFQELMLFFGSIWAVFSLGLFVIIAVVLIWALFFFVHGPVRWLAALALYLVCGIVYVIRDLRKPGFLGHFGPISRDYLSPKIKVALIWPFYMLFDAIDPPFLESGYSWKRKGRDGDGL